MSDHDPTGEALQSTETHGGERDKRLCTKERDDGSLCKAYRVKGQPYCAGHLGLGTLDASRAAAASAAARQRTAERRKLGYREALTEALEAKAAAIVERLVDIVENGSDADALRAIEAMSNRVLGRPTERVEVDTPETPRTVEAIRSMTTEQRQALLRRLDERGMRLIEGASEG